VEVRAAIKAEHMALVAFVFAQSVVKKFHTREE